MPKSKSKGEKIQQNPNPLLVSTTHEVQYSGPLPPPGVLKQYKEIYPEAPEIIITAFENQVAHRIQSENRVISANIRHQSIGQWFGFIVALIVIVGGLVVILLDKEVEGIVAILACLTSLVTVFIAGRWKVKKESAKKTDPE